MNHNQNLYLRNLKRKENRLKNEKYLNIFEIKIIKKGLKWRHFRFKKGKNYLVRIDPLKTTSKGDNNFCNCPKCLKQRKGKKLYEMYEVVSGKHTYALIPISCCKTIHQIDNKELITALDHL